MISTTQLKLFNYFYFSLFATLLSFLPVYVSYRGISTTGIGLMMGLCSLIGIVSQPLWGIISDKWNTIRRVLLLVLGATVVLGTCFYLTEDDGLLFLLSPVIYFFFMPTDPLVESLNYQTSRRAGVNYGSIRMFGALGYAMASLLVGYWVDWAGMDRLFLVYGAYGIGAFALCLRLQDVPVSGQPVHFHELKRFFMNARTLRFLLLVLALAIPHRMNDSFIGVYLQEQGGDVGDIGWAWFVMAISEFVFFSISHRFLKQGKEMRVVTIAALLYAVRFLLCAAVSDPLVIVLLQLLQGVTFVLFYTASIQHLYSIIPEEWKVTGQTILAVLFFGVSGIVGSSLGGRIMDVYGGSRLYLLMSLLALIGCLASLRFAKAAA